MHASPTTCWPEQQRAHGSRLGAPCVQARLREVLLMARQVTLVAESFGGALALRVAAAAPQLLSRLVVVRVALARLTQQRIDCLFPSWLCVR